MFYLISEWKVKYKTHQLTSTEERCCLKVLCKCLNDLLEADEKTRGTYIASDQDIKVTNTTIIIHFLFEVRKGPYYHYPDMDIIGNIIQNCLDRNRMKIKLGEILGHLEPR